MNLKELIKYVFEHYPIRKPTGFNERQGKGDPLVSIIKKGLTQIENSELVLGERYSSKGLQAWVNGQPYHGLACSIMKFQ